MLVEAVFEVVGQCRVDNFSWQVSPTICNPVWQAVFTLFDLCYLFHDPVLVSFDITRRSFVCHHYALFIWIVPDKSLFIFIKAFGYFEKLDQSSRLSRLSVRLLRLSLHSLGSLGLPLISLRVFLPSPVKWRPFYSIILLTVLQIT